MVEEANLPEIAAKFIEELLKLTREEQIHALTYTAVGLNLVSTLNLVGIRESSESLSESSKEVARSTRSLSDSSKELVTLTRRIMWSSIALVVESIAIAGFTAALLIHGL